jgi:RNA polymerase sigma-70 factor (ECF subfamily)
MDQDFILHKLKIGDKDSFDFIFRNYYPGMVVFAMEYIPDKDKAEEVVQGVFVKLWEDREKIEIKVSLKSYIFKVIQNKCLDTIKHNSIKKRVESEVIAKSSISENDFFSYNLYEKAEQSINNLPDTVKKIFKMSRYENKKYGEIANSLNISIKTVEANIGKALRILREDLKDWL